MAVSNGKTVSINLQVLTDKLSAGLKKATSETKQWGDTTKDTISSVEQSTERISRLWRSAFEAFIGFEAINMLKKLALGAAEAADQLDVASRVAQNFGHALNPAQMEAWLEAFSKSAQGGGYAIDDMRRSVQEFAALGLDNAQIQRAIADTAAIAAARNLDFGESANIVREALTGHVELLTRYGIISREAAKGIHTVEQAMRAVESASSGAAEERSKNLIGTFGRLASAASLLRDAIGTGLVPFFSEIATVLTNLANIAKQIPQPVINATVSFVAMGVGLAATALVLPAITKGFLILWEGVKLGLAVFSPLLGVLKVMRTATLALADANLAAAASYLAEAAVPALIIAGLVALIAIIVELAIHITDTKKLWADLCRLMADEWHGLVAQLEHDFAPLISFFGQIMTAISSAWKSFAGYLHDVWDAFVSSFGQLAKRVVDALGGVVSALQPVMNAWDRFCSFLSTRFQSFVDTLQHQSLVVKATLAALIPPVGLPLGIQAGLGVGESGKTRGDEHRVGSDLGKIGKDMVDDWKKMMSSVTSLFKPTAGPNLKIPTEAFTGIVPGEKKAKDNSGEVAENALKNAEEAIKDALERFIDRVADARHQAEKSTTAVDQYKATLPGGEPQNEQQAAELQKLITNELRAQQTLHDRLVDQQHAELAAQAALEKYAGTISKHLKNHDELVRQAKDAAREHLHTAQQLGEEYLRIGVTVAKLKSDIRASFEKAIDNSTSAQIDALESQLASKKIGYSGQEEAITSQLDRMRVTKGSKPVDEDRLKIALAQLAVAAAEDTEAEKNHAVALLQEEYDRTKSHDALQKLTEAQQQAMQSTLDVVKANDALNLAQDQLIVDQKQKWDDFINTLVQKANVPGLEGTAQAGFSFNPLALLMEALEKTQLFADVMNTVTQIVDTFAQALDAFRPIIDALLDVVRAVVNVFIFLYNAVARILDLFGLQIQQLQYLTDAMAGLVPLISIVHEIPTLNELAAGRLNSPLSTVPQGNNTLGQRNGGQNALMRVVEILVGILAAVVIEKMISGLSFTQAVQQTMHLLGINVGQKQQIAQSAIQAAKQAAITLSDAAKQAALTINSNVLLLQISTTLVAILAALQTKNVIDFFSMFTGGIPGGGDAGVGAGADAAVGGAAASQSGGPLASAAQTVGAAASSLSGALSQPIANLVDGLTRLSRALSQPLTGLQRLADASRTAADSISRMSAAANRAAFGGAGGGSVTDINTSLALDTMRRSATSGYGIDRAPS